MNTTEKFNPDIEEGKLVSQAVSMLRSKNIPVKLMRRNALAAVEKYMGRKCEGCKLEFYREFIRYFNEQTRATPKQPVQFKPLQLPKDLRLAAAKVADYPVPVSMSSRVTNAFQDHSR